MRINPAAAIVFAIYIAPRVLGQTPPGTSPSTNLTLAVRYGSTEVTSGIMLPRSGELMSRISDPSINFLPNKTIVTINIPGFTFTPSFPSQTYILLMADLSVSISALNASALNPTYQLPFAPGITSDRTTRLHFWQAGLTFSSNSTLINSTEPVAYYTGPAPPPGPLHTYVFYLFEQEDGFTTPPADSPFNTANVYMSLLNAMSFNVQTFADKTGVGPLVAANYITYHNTSGSSSATASGTGSPTGSASSPQATAF